MTDNNDQATTRLADIRADLDDGIDADDAVWLLSLAEQLQGQLDERNDLIRDLHDDGPCRFDRHGYCHDHNWFETDPPCPDSRAQALVQELGVPGDLRIGGDHPMSYPTELTPAQQAAAEFLRDIHAARQGLPAEITPDIRAEARAVVAAVRPHIATEPPVHDDIHHYLSTGCLHGEMTLPDGRTGHQYCQGMTGMAGAKRGGRCKFCDAPCQCPCHQATESETTR